VEDAGRKPRQNRSSGAYQAAVQRDVEEGTRVGVTWHPDLFIDGRVLVSAYPPESFVRVNREKLAQAQ
jgi:predicted DsbA family dithiol-disulfide isomerase